jgi:hypothetical protein
MSVENKQSSESQIIIEPNFSMSAWILEWVISIKKIITHHFKIIFLVTLLGSMIGIAYSYIKSPRYIADTIFLVEESKSMGGGGLLSSLGGSLGMDITGLTGSNNTVLSGDNVLELLKSKTFMAQCLKTPYLNDSNYSIADKYADVYKYRAQWENDEKIGRAISFAKPDKNKRVQDSLLKIIVNRIEEKELSVVKPDKKLGFFKMTVTTKEENLSKLISEKLLKIATDFYIEAKVGRLRKNVVRLEKRTDSIYNLLNYKTQATRQDALLLLNGNFANVNEAINSEISQRDKGMLTSIYGQLITNLEASKASLIQETPTVQIVDSPVFPLEKSETKWYIGLLMGLFVSFFAGIFYFLVFNKI